MTNSYDAIVAGAGPAGSTAARLLARSGAHVLMLDKALFPRDKPCGGGVTFRADAAIDLDLSPVTEREIYSAYISADMQRPFERASRQLLARMTQRSRLDAYLSEEAARAGADFRDGHGAREITLTETGVTVRANGDVYTARVLIGADGVNGATAATLGLAPAGEHAIALEANYPLDDALAGEWAQKIALDLGGVPGGYCWLFPKGDHVNLGVGGWNAIGPTLRDRLQTYTRFLGLDPARLDGHRGYRLPIRHDGSPVVRGNAMLVGDAAALVDPLSGEGIWAAFVSGRLAAQETQRLLAGEVGDLEGYQRSLEAEVRDEIITSLRLRAILHRLPLRAVTLLKHSNRLWSYVTQIIRGDLTYPELPKKLGPLRYAVYRWGDWEMKRQAHFLDSPGRRTSA